MSGIIKSAARSALVLAVALMLGVAGCGGAKTRSGGAASHGASKELSDVDKARLGEARESAEAAEKKLSDLRLERTKLESGGQ